MFLEESHSEAQSKMSHSSKVAHKILSLLFFAGIRRIKNFFLKIASSFAELPSADVPNPRRDFPSVVVVHAPAAARGPPHT